MKILSRLCILIQLSIQCIRTQLGYDLLIWLNSNGVAQKQERISIIRDERTCNTLSNHEVQSMKFIIRCNVSILIRYQCFAFLNWPLIAHISDKLWATRLSWLNPNQGIQVDDSGNLQTSKNFFNGDVRVTVKDANGNILDQKDESIQGCSQAVLK